MIANERLSCILEDFFMCNTEGAKLYCREMPLWPDDVFRLPALQRHRGQALGAW